MSTFKAAYLTAYEAGLLAGCLETAWALLERAPSACESAVWPVWGGRRGSAAPAAFRQSRPTDPVSGKRGLS